MESEKGNADKISRKKFLSLFGTVVAGGSIVGVSGVLLHKNSWKQKNGQRSQGFVTGQQQDFASPYKLVSSFSVPDKMKSFEIYEDKLIVAASDNVFVYDKNGTLSGNFAVNGEVRDIAVGNHLLYLLFPAAIGVFDLKGKNIRYWEACSPESDYCSLAVTTDFVFVTDAANKNICKYTVDGGFMRFIQSPNGFIIPSYTFGITYIDETIYCSNPGRHQVESYSFDGEYIAAFGKAGGANGMFCGCCNPTHLAHTSTGDIITSEKGNPRISCYGQDGEFRSLLLDSKALGGGNVAYDVKLQKDKIYIAGNNMVSTFQYDQVLAAKTSCATCKVDCPLRKGVFI